jgi:hypothetical protein
VLPVLLFQLWQACWFLLVAVRLAVLLRQV